MIVLYTEEEDDKISVIEMGGWYLRVTRLPRHPHHTALEALATHITPKWMPINATSVSTGLPDRRFAEFQRQPPKNAVTGRVGESFRIQRITTSD
jgi:hypothetical protein